MSRTSAGMVMVALIITGCGADREVTSTKPLGEQSPVVTTSVSPAPPITEFDLADFLDQMVERQGLEMIPTTPSIDRSILLSTSYVEGRLGTPRVATDLETLPESGLQIAHVMIELPIDAVEVDGAPVETWVIRAWSGDPRFVTEEAKEVDGLLPQALAGSEVALLVRVATVGSRSGGYAIDGVAEVRGQVQSVGQDRTRPELASVAAFREHVDVAIRAGARLADPVTGPRLPR